MWLSEKKRKGKKWGGSSPRRGMQNGSRKAWVRPWPLFLLLQLFICLWYLALLLACCGSPITTRLSHIITHPSTFTYFFCCHPSFWFSSSFHILPVEALTFPSHVQSMTHSNELWCLPGTFPSCYCCYCYCCRFLTNLHFILSGLDPSIRLSSTTKERRRQNSYVIITKVQAYLSAFFILEILYFRSHAGQRHVTL